MQDGDGRGVLGGRRGGDQDQRTGDADGAGGPAERADRAHGDVLPGADGAVTPCFLRLCATGCSRPENSGPPPRWEDRTVPTDRDRDAEGRARNARPRDALGRPLPYGAAGEERAPEGVVRTPAETLAEAQALLDAGPAVPRARGARGRVEVRPRGRAAALAGPRPARRRPHPRAARQRARVRPPCWSGAREASPAYADGARRTASTSPGSCAWARTARRRDRRPPRLRAPRAVPTAAGGAPAPGGGETMGPAMSTDTAPAPGSDDTAARRAGRAAARPGHLGVLLDHRPAHRRRRPGHRSAASPPPWGPPAARSPPST